MPKKKKSPEVVSIGKGGGKFGKGLAFSMESSKKMKKAKKK